jgi:serine/threonine-protein kinase
MPVHGIMQGSVRPAERIVTRMTALSPEYPAASRPRAQWSTGDQVGPYRLEREVASGGMATVYAARMEGPGGFTKRVALKFIHPHLAKDAGFVRMFFDEARIAARIEHPNVCGVFGFGEVDGAYYLAMEYLEGSTLRQLRAAAGERAPAAFPPAVVARIVADAAEGLHAAHELVDDEGRSLRVVHRDVSPHNLMLTRDGSVRVLDFGIAHAMGRLQETRSGELKGKLGYMAPELVRRGAVDRRVDIWSLGVVAWELLTGRRLFDACRSEADTLLAILSEPIARPSSHAPAVSAELDDIVLGALARNPDERYRTARALARALEAHLARGGHLSRADLVDWMDRRDEPGPKGEPRVGTSEATRTPSLPPPHSAAPVASAAPRKAGRPWAWAAVGAGAAAVLGLLAYVLLGGFEGTPESPGMPESEVGGTRGAAEDPTRLATPPAAAKSGDPRTPHEPAAVRPPDDDGADAERRQVSAKGSGSGDRLPESADRAPADAEGASEVDSSEPEQTPAHSARERRPHREAPHRRAAVRHAAPGAVLVRVDGGWAEVSHRGRSLGQTPLRAELPAGRQTLVLRFGDGAERRVAVRVPSGGTTQLRVDAP